MEDYRWDSDNYCLNRMTHLSLMALIKFYKGLAPYVSQWRNPQHKEYSCEFQQIISGLSLKFSCSLWDPSFLPFSHFLYSASLFLLFTLVHTFQNAVSTTLFFAYLRLLFFYSYLSHFLAIKLICFFTFFLIFHYYWFFPLFL